MMTSALSSRSPGPSSSPAPISWSPSEYWDGDDGYWSSFAVRVGNPGQVVRVLISTASEATWVVLPKGCLPDNGENLTPALTCPYTRGELFDPTQSNTWSSVGNYSLGAELNLDYNDEASYGIDKVALGFSNATGGPTLRSQVVAGIETYDFYTGLFGLGNQPINFTASNDTSNLTDTIPYPSFLTSLKTQNLIPSLSWAYTAGAYYRLKGVFGSLTFGGYDLSKFIPNNVTFNLAPDISRDLVVGLQSITSTAANGSVVSLLPTPILTFIDSTLPYIYLPPESCQAFENAFDLTWNDTAEYYFVNDSLHQSLTARNPNVTFQIGNTQTGGPTVDIVLPYGSFDLVALYPMVLNTTRYFPLQRGNATQYTLGRTFLQEAYVITNYEYSNFSVSQARFEDGLPENIIAIPSSDSPAPKPHNRNGRNLVIGLSIGATVFLILVVFFICFVRKRRRNYSQNKDMSKNTGSPRFSQDAKPANLSAPHEIDNNSLYLQRELPDSGKVELLDENSPSGSGIKISEMPQSPTPVPPCELGTGHTSTTTSSLHRQSDKNRYAIVVQTGISLESSDSVGARKESPCVETVISSSPRHTSPGHTSPNLNRPRLILQYLDKPLPSTPGSDSTQITPTTTSHSSHFPATNRNRHWSSRTSVTISDSGSASQDAVLDMFWKDYDMSWNPRGRQKISLLSSSSKNIDIMIVPEVAEGQIREHPSLSSLSTDSDNALSRGTPISQTTSRPFSRKGERRIHENFF